MKTLACFVSAATLCGALISNFTYASDAKPLLDSLSVNSNSSVPSLSPIIDKVTPSVVSIYVEGSKIVERNMPNNFDFFFGGDPFGFNPFSQGNPEKAEKKFRALGSGVIIDAEKGYIVTNNHVVNDAKTIKVETKDGRQFEAKKIGADPQTDFALLQIDAKELTAIRFADSDKLKVGDFAVAIGNPFGLGQTVTYGIISALGRSVDGNTDQFENYIQTDAAINQGNSGGSLIDLRGELIGINTAIIAPNGGNVGIGFAIPSNMIKSLTEQIIKYGEVRRGFLGIMGGELTHDLAEKFGSKYNHGAFVNQVMKDSAADVAGIKAGDIIVSIDGKEIKSFNELRAKIATLGAGKKIKLGVVRNGEELSVDVVLKESEPQKVVTNNKQIDSMFDGAKLSDASGSIKGVEVVELDPKSKIARMGIEKGDIIVAVNRQSVDSVSSLNDALAKSSGAQAIKIVRGNMNMYIILR